MERMQEMRKSASLIEKELFVSQCRKLEQEYEKTGNRMAAIEALSALFDNANEVEKEVSWLTICYLHTSVKTKSYELLVSLYTKEFLFDQVPIQTYWRPPCFFDCFEEDMEAVMKRLRRKFVRIKTYEEDFVRETCIEYFYAAIRQLIMDLESEVVETNAFREMKRGGTFSASFGRYHGEGEILWRINSI